ncbi:lmo0937 family membrane protein [Terriglobus aquaticus]|uniref:Lmo0937 family membrane protein n=1 Tax=Terriglobus aquaticus TaxID=940139 RepID=A0ABW9KI12_9BACT|nr:lmo0937 family membrane protein [Terriglobus aquaticus]
MATLEVYVATMLMWLERPRISALAASVQGIRRKTMLWTITILLVVLWILGLVSSYTLGGWIHILLVLAVIILIFNLLSGRRAL